MNVKDIYNRIQLLNTTNSEISSLGSFVSESNRIAQEVEFNIVKGNLPENTLAYKILTSNNNYTQKQLWVIAYELLKNEEYVNSLSKEITRKRGKAAQKEAESKAKLNANKVKAQPVKDYIKENGALLKDYYAFVKSNKQYAKEFYSKKFTMESANAFLNK